MLGIFTPFSNDIDLQLFVFESFDAGIFIRKLLEKLAEIHSDFVFLNLLILL